MIEYVVKLSELVTIKGGGTPKRSEPSFWNGEIPWATVKDFSSNQLNLTIESITKLGLDNSATNLIPKGSIIIPSRMAVGKVAINNIDMAINQDLKALLIKNDCNVNRDYLWRFLLSKADYFKSRSKGATVKGITIDVLKELSIPLPPLEEQKRIAAILDKADQIRRKRQQAIDLSEQFLRSVFLDMFGDPVTNPKGWETKAWNGILEIVNGKNQKKVEDENGQYPICGSGGEIGRAKEWLTPKNSVILGRKGNINKPILMHENFWNVDTAFGLLPDSQYLSHNYLYWFCKFFDFERLNKAVTIPSLTKTDLLKLLMPLPPIHLQSEFDKLVTAEKNMLKKITHQYEDLESLFYSLSQKAFKGELT